MFSLVNELLQDARELGRVALRRSDNRSALKAALHYDSYTITALQRLRAFSRARCIFGVNHALRVVQTAVFGIEIGKDVRLGRGVWFIHPVGITIGGNSKIGDRVRFFGNNTVGQAKEDGYPIIEDDVWVGAGARVLGAIRIGARSMIGANAVVLKDVPPDSVAIGIPARIIAKNKAYESNAQ